MSILRTSYNSIKAFPLSEGVSGSQNSLIRAKGVYSSLAFFVYGFFNWFSSLGILHSIKEQSRTNRNRKASRGRNVFVKYLNTNPCNAEPCNMAFDNFIISIQMEPTFGEGQNCIVHEVNAELIISLSTSLLYLVNSIYRFIKGERERYIKIILIIN